MNDDPLISALGRHRLRAGAAKDVYRALMDDAARLRDPSAVEALVDGYIGRREHLLAPEPDPGPEAAPPPPAPGDAAWSHLAEAGRIAPNGALRLDGGRSYGPPPARPAVDAARRAAVAAAADGAKARLADAGRLTPGGGFKIA